MISRRLLSIAFVTLSITAVLGHTQTLIKAKKLPTSAVIAKNDEKKPRPPKEVTLPAIDQGYIDWSYLRLNHPVLMDAMVERVRKGEADIATLGGLATADKLKEYASGGSKAKPAGGAAVPVGSLSKSGVMVRPNSGLLNAIKSKPSVLLQPKYLLPLEVSPGKVEFGSVVDGQAVRKAITIRNAPAGVAKALISGKSPFRILSVRVMDGRFAMSRPGAWKESLIATYGPEAAGLPGNSNRNSTNSALTRPRLDPGVVGKLSTANSTLKGAALLKPSESLVKKARLEATASPFEVDAPEGAMVRVVVEYRPKFNIFSGDPVGRHQANLELAAGSQSAQVNLNAFFEGVNLGVITIPQDREVTLFAIRKEERHPSGGNMVTAQQTFRFYFPITYLNPKEEARVGFEPVELPPGVTLDSGDVHTAPNGRSEGTLGFTVDFWGDGRGAQFGMGQEIYLKVHSPAGVRYLSLTLNLLPSMRSYSSRGVVDDVFYDITIAAFEDGSLNCEYSFRTTNAWPTDAEFKFSIDGVQMIHYNTIWMNSDNRMKTSGSPKFKSQALADEWSRFVLKGGSFWIKVTEKFRL